MNPVTKEMNPEDYVALLYDRWLKCISQWTQTPEKVFHKLLMSFHMQKKLLGQQRNQIFNQGIFFWGGGGGGVESDLENCACLWKILATPLIHTQQNYIAADVKVVLYTYTANFFSKCFNSKSFSFFIKCFYLLAVNRICQTLYYKR